MPSAETRILVVGCGSIGRRHIRLLREMDVEVAGFEIDANQRERLAAEFPNLSVYHTADLPVRWLYMPLFRKFDGVIVATPTYLHVHVAQASLMCGRPTLVEKPITANSADAKGLLSEAVAPLLVGYCLRWHPGLQRVKAMLDSGTIGKPLHANIHFGHYLPDWHPGQDYRRWYSAHRDQGGGVLLDASHELDYACWLLGEPVSVSATVQNSGTLGIDCEDIADVTLRFASGAQANIHLDYLDRNKQRCCRVVGAEGTVSCDLTRDSYMVPLEDQKKFPGGYAWQAFQPDDMYRAELRHFLAVCRGEEQPLVTGADGLRAVRIVEAAKESSATGRVVIL